MDKRLNVGIDLDDTLLDFFGNLCTFYNTRNGTNYQRDQVTSFYLEHVWSCSRQEVLDILTDFYDSDDHFNLPPVKGAQDAIRSMSLDHNLHLITSKPDYLKEKTSVWLRKHYGDVFMSLNFNNQFHSDGPKKTKLEVCREIGVNVLIDDHIENLVSTSEAGIHSLLIDAPWNQGDLPVAIRRVYSWSDIPSILSKL